MQLLLAIFWLGFAALLLGFPKVLLWLVIAFFVVLFLRAPVAAIFGVLLGITFFGKDTDC